MAPTGLISGHGVALDSSSEQPQNGLPFVLYVNRLRINRACQLLMSGELGVTGIRYQVGNNLSNFNCQFLLLKELWLSRWRAYQQLDAASATVSHDAAHASEAFS